VRKWASATVCSLLLLPRLALGVDVLLRWTVPPEADLVGYRLYRGEASRAYTTRWDLDLLPATTVDGVTAFLMVDAPLAPSFVAVTAVNRAGLESDYSNEKGIPTFAGGLPTADAGLDVSGDVGQAVVVGSGPVAGTTYLWRQVSGPSELTMGDRWASRTTVRGALAGTYEIELIAADAHGFARRDRVVVSVRAALTPSTPPVTATPTATASPRFTATPVGPDAFGAVEYYASGLPVPDVEVDVVDPLAAPAGDPVGSVRTDLAGRFAIPELPRAEWIVGPRGSVPYPSAVTALDAAYVLQALTGDRELTAAQRLACDASGNGTLSAFDASMILQLSVGLRATLPAADRCGGAWLFDPIPEWPGLDVYPARLDAGGCESGFYGGVGVVEPVGPLRFQAIELGDCTGSWAAGGAAAAVDASPVTATVDVQRLARHQRSATLQLTSSQPLYAVAAELTTAARVLRVRPPRRSEQVVVVAGVVGAGRIVVALASAVPLSATAVSELALLVDGDDDAVVGLAWVRINDGHPWRPGAFDR